MESCNVWSFVSSALGSSMSQQVSVLHPILWSSNIPLYAQIYHILLTQSSADGYLGCPLLGYYARSCSSFCVYICFHSFGYMLRSRIAGSHGNTVNTLMNCLFSSVCTISHSSSQCMRVPGSPHCEQCCYHSNANWCLLLFICITNDVKHLFMHLLAIFISSLNKCLFKSLALKILKKLGYLSYY